MDLKDFLKNDRLINVSALAERMYPDVKSARSKLHNKINEATVGTGKQRITEKDAEDAKRILKELAEKINSIK